MSKKGQALSLNTIIVAIVVLIVLVVLIMIFTGYFGSRFTPEITSCANSGGVCADDQGNPARCGYDVFDTPKAVLTPACTGLDEGKICCARGLGTGSAPIETTLSNEETCTSDFGCVQEGQCKEEDDDEDGPGMGVDVSPDPSLGTCNDGSVCCQSN